jgi:hypothetical protein
MAWVVGGAENTVAPVIVRSGSGQWYRIDVYANGLDAPPSERGAQAQHPRLSGNDTLPANTVTFAVRAGGQWYLMESTWL